MSCAFTTNSGAGPGLVFRTFHDERLLHNAQADLKKHLDDYNPKSPFPYPDRPLSLKGWTVIAIIKMTPRAKSSKRSNSKPVARKLEMRLAGTATERSQSLLF